MKQLWIILAFAVQAMCCGSGWAFDINGPLGPGGGGIFGDGGTNPGITDDCQCSYLMVVLSPFCQDLNAGCTITGKVIGITYGGSCDVLLTLRTYPTNVLQFVTNTTVDGINTEYLTDFLSVTSSCSAGIIETNFVVRGLTTTPEGQFSGLIAELYKCGALCGVYTQELDVVQLQGISVSPQAAQVNEDVTFTAQMSPAGSGGSILSWSGGGQPATGTGTVFTNRWSTPGTYTVTVSCGINSECAGTTSVNVPVLKVDIEYVGGTSATDARQETLLTLDDKYFMKGYMLKITAPNIQPGSTVTWSITKAGSAAGTYHNGSAWTDYGTTLASAPTTRTIYWRSDTAGAITDVYKVSTTFTPPGASTTVTCTREIKSRLLDPTIAQHRDNFNEDADMTQRTMVQVFYLDKGRLNVYRPGQYDKYSQNGFYHCSRSPYPDWSSVADEVWNFDKFALGSATPPDPHPFTLTVIQGIWSEFNFILAAGVQPEQDATTPAYNATWIPNAITTSDLTMPAGFTKTSGEVLKALVRKEGNKHSWPRHDPLAVNSIDIGQVNGSAGGAHTYTDGGLGYCKVQPYNAGGRNLYAPQDNLIKGAEVLQANIGDAANPGATANEKVWYAVFRYNRGNYGGVPIKTPLQLRSGGGLNAQSAAYADAIFGYLGLTPP